MKGQFMSVCLGGESDLTTLCPFPHSELIIMPAFDNHQHSLKAALQTMSSALPVSAGIQLGATHIAWITLICACCSLDWIPTGLNYFSTLVFSCTQSVLHHLYDFISTT